ncbi:hypothetical protein LZ519_09695 [Sphingomonas sp. RG327]|uniref:TonB C-terminal domain-containing protein n=1 Tax=Sphingomonas anseongensis TaxID=2908207 RepID=A0ABT0RH31_9SPHN|nr:hypothetical protein [Sphingomonas anseongensis]MCL6679582.1 hypothetical protein [Sphingomonas anseongensis]
MPAPLRTPTRQAACRSNSTQSASLDSIAIDPHSSAVLSLLAASSLLSAPTPIEFGRWFGGDDYPAEVLGGNQTAFQPVTETAVDSSGKIRGCRIEAPSGSAKIDALACAIILKRGAFKPATWTDGTPVPGVYRTAIIFLVFGDRLPTVRDIDISVQQLPKGEKSPATVNVAIAAEANGTITDCVDEPRSTKPKPDNPALVSVACDTIKAQWKPVQVLDSEGKPSRSVQNVMVAFTEAE